MHRHPPMLSFNLRLASAVCLVLMSVWGWVPSAAQNLPPSQSNIPFANLGGIRDWRPAGDDVLYVQGRNRKWYRAELFAPCRGLNLADALGFDVRPGGSFDRFASVIVEGRECPLKSLIESEPPTSGQRGRSGENVEASSARPSVDAKVSSGKSGQSAAEAMRIPFADFGGIQSWRAVDEVTLFIEGRSRRWYRAEMFDRCPGLRSHSDIGFVLQPGEDFDRLAALMVDGRECRLKSLTVSDGP